MTSDFFFEDEKIERQYLEQSEKVAMFVDSAATEFPHRKLDQLYKKSDMKHIQGFDHTCNFCGGAKCQGYGTNEAYIFSDVPENGLCSCWEKYEEIHKESPKDENEAFWHDGMNMWMQHQPTRIILHPDIAYDVVSDGTHLDDLEKGKDYVYG
jgi:hypothetical protein